MTHMDLQTLKDMNVIGAFLSGLVGAGVGAGGAYMAIKMRLKSLEDRVTKVEARMDVRDTDFRAHGERLVRMETKLDMILNKA